MVVAAVAVQSDCFLTCGDGLVPSLQLQCEPAEQLLCLRIVAARRCDRLVDAKLAEREVEILAHLFAAASTVTGLDYGTVFSAVGTELTAAIAGVAPVAVGVFVAIYVIRLLKRVFKTLAR